MAPLTSKTRNSLPSNDFVLPGERKYPIPDKAHGRNALARAAQNASPEVEAKVKAAVKRKFPSIVVEGEASKPRADRSSRRKD